MKIYTYRSGHKTLKKVLSITLSLLVMVQMVPTLALAQGQPHYEITGNTPNLSNLTVTWDGNALGNPVAGQVDDHGVCIDWDEDQDSTTHTWVDANFNPTFGTDSFSATWNGNHTYSGSGTYHIFARVHHATCTGAESSDLGTVADVVIIPPPANNYTLDATVVGDGSVTSDPSGITCESDCSESYVENTSVDLTATASTTSDFVSWTGCNSVVGNVCTVSMTANKSVTATFTLKTLTLTASTDGNGSGVVTSDLGVIDCGSTCSDDYNYGDDVTLTATASSGSVFAGWSGACAGSGTSTTCVVSITDATSVTATFNLIPPPNQFTLTALISGDGSVTSNPTGITCLGDCSENYLENTSVDLTATASTTSDFVSWTGCNSVVGNVCTVSMTANKSVTATFQLKQTSSPDRFTLTVETTGDGSGSVTGTGINCISGNSESDCSETYDEGTVVELTATANGGSNFNDTWFNACSGNNPVCSVTMNSNQTATAHFSLNQTNTTTTSGGGSSHHSGGGGIVLGINNDEPQGQVLGATFTPGLPATGNGPINSDSTNTLIVLFAGLMVLVGLNMASFKALKLEVK